MVVVGGPVVVVVTVVVLGRVVVVVVGRGVVVGGPVVPTPAVALMWQSASTMTVASRMFEWESTVFQLLDFEVLSDFSVLLSTLEIFAASVVGFYTAVRINLSKSCIKTAWKQETENNGNFEETKRFQGQVSRQ